MSYLTTNMEMIAECAAKLARLREKLFNNTEMKIMMIGQTAEFSCPDGYEFVDENGNVINATKIVLEKKKEYPKTYEECCKVLNTDDDSIIDISVPLHYRHLLISFTQLLICCDAYWKIAGEEMGLNRPWKPDLTDNVIKHCIEFRDCGVCKVTYSYTSKVLAFPTAEMRDAFYENFKELIEQCKELL